MLIRIFVVCLILSSLFACKNHSKYIYNEGSVYGTIYHVVYESPDGKDIHEEIKDKFDQLNRIFSTFDPSSVISKINNNQPVELCSEFISCFRRSMEVSEITGGAFDITAGSMVNAWGFGPEERKKMTPEIIDSLKAITGYKKIRLSEGKIYKESLSIKLDMSAIAKGYTCDIIGDMLESAGCVNYMVEIGGEVVARGINEKGRVWTIGISKPDDSGFFISSGLQAKIRLKENAIATSGNYRNFYIDGGKKYAHTIDPETGYPVDHNLLSATVMASRCMDADAFATAFMVMGLEKSIHMSRQFPDLEVYLIYADENGDNSIYMSDGFKGLLTD